MEDSLNVVSGKLQYFSIGNFFYSEVQSVFCFVFVLGEIQNIVTTVVIAVFCPYAQSMMVGV
jgi:hypothetical protein